jgi:hypothetical protein
MALPHDHDVQLQLLSLLNESPGGTLHCQDIYGLLAERFPGLTPDDVSGPFGNSVSHWANRVQFARLHLVLTGLMDPTYFSGRAYWAISDAGRIYIENVARQADELLKELDGLG